ncbi:uncharacterized protein EI90DRAFT_2416427 [Cantharellus anzutake]|uniref:uncharacterized protein n=1 Tax=Cantharellus anzutake TaxID=1750568 RepID=UPI0019082ED0|nr:uncharacterized protein EI90DRAFT_2416427 [Cantharellus anzutake]KAF8338791.1 hypothetical protein EI90DRAFT_2416427 [Cantharellus anzutake]
MRLSSSSTLLRVASSSPRALCLSLAYNRSPTIIRVTSSGPAAAVPLLPSSYLYSTQSQNSSSQTLKSVPEIYLSHSIDPYFNLAFEDWLFRSKPVEAIALLFYRNSPCVIIGRNQVCARKKLK